MKIKSQSFCHSFERNNNNILVFYRNVFKVPEKKPFQSRFLPNHQSVKKDETESSSEEETTSEETDDDDDTNQTNVKKATGNASGSNSVSNRNSQTRDTYDSRRNSRDETYNSRAGRYKSPLNVRDSDESKSTSAIRSRARQTEPEEPNSRYGSSK